MFYAMRMNLESKWMIGLGGGTYATSITLMPLILLARMFLNKDPKDNEFDFSAMIREVIKKSKPDLVFVIEKYDFTKLEI